MPACSRKLRFESLEDRRVLSSSADVIFLVDQSSSSDGAGDDLVQNRINSMDWLRDNLTQFDSSLDLNGVTDRRYGLVGFGGGGLNNSFGAHFQRECKSLTI